MIKRYYSIAVCADTKYLDNENRIGDLFTQQGNLVIRMNRTSTGSKFVDLAAEDMNKVRISESDSVFIINPDGIMSENLYSELCFALMINKEIDSLYPINISDVLFEINRRIQRAKKLADFQSLIVNDNYLRGDYEDLSYYISNNRKVFNPWLGMNNINYSNAFNNLDKVLIARFIEDIIARNDKYASVFKMIKTKNNREMSIM